MQFNLCSQTFHKVISKKQSDIKKSSGVSNVNFLAKLKQMDDHKAAFIKQLMLKITLI